MMGLWKLNKYRWVRELAHPPYDCEDCIGMIQHGCQCAYYGAPAPGMAPEWWRELLRKILK